MAQSTNIESSSVFEQVREASASFWSLTQSSHPAPTSLRKHVGRLTQYQQAKSLSDESSKCRLVKLERLRTSRSCLSPLSRYSHYPATNTSIAAYDVEITAHYQQARTSLQALLANQQSKFERLQIGTWRLRSCLAILLPPYNVYNERCGNTTTTSDELTMFRPSS